MGRRVDSRHKLITKGQNKRNERFAHTNHFELRLHSLKISKIVRRIDTHRIRIDTHLSCQ